MRRILVVGAGGAGKSHFAVQLGALTGLPVIHLDARYWRSGWVEPPKSEWATQVTKLIAGDRWILDGNYGGTLALRLAACDTVVFLDLPRRVTIPRVLGRWWTYRGRNRPDMPEGCPERPGWDFLYWIWTYPRVRRPGVLKQIEAAGPSVRLIRLRSVTEVEIFLEAVQAANSG